MRHPKIRFVSLGEMGTWRTTASRRRHVAHVVDRASREFDVLMLWLSNRRVTEVLAANRCPRVVSIDGNCERLELRTTPMPIGRKLRRLPTVMLAEHRSRQAGARSGLVIVNSRMLTSRYPGRNVKIIRWTTHRDDESFRAPDRLTDSADFLFAGRIASYKGAFEAADAFAAIKRSIRPDARLDVAGDGPDLEAMRARVRELGVDDAVTFRGFVPGEVLAELYRRADVLLHPSYAESFPRVILEALAHSVLVVCTPVGGVGEQFHDGDEVLFASPRSVEEIVAAVKRLNGDPSLRAGLLSRGFDAGAEGSADAFAERTLGAVAETWPELASVGESR
jgi:glycosyltransferase involved in cell wall biosynthesis